MKAMAIALASVLCAYVAFSASIDPMMATKSAPTTKGAQAMMQGAKASFIASQPPLVITNYLTLGFYSGNDYGNGGRVFVQSHTDPSQSFTNLVGYLMNDRQISQQFSFTNPSRFFRLKWFPATNTYTP